MANQEIPLLKAMYQKMDWHESRQKVLSEVIANADTPNYTPKDLKPIDFKSVLSNSTSSISLATSSGMHATNSKHITSNPGSASGSKAKTVSGKNEYEFSPAGNGVVLEEQLMKMNENMMDHRFITNLYQKNMEMLKRSTGSQ